MDLNAPLGLETSPRRKRTWTFLVPVVAATALSLGGLGYVLATADPHGGEPFAVVDLPLRPSQPSSPVDPMPTGSLASAPTETSRGAQPDRDDPGEWSLENGVRVRRGTGSVAAGASPSARAPLVIDVSHQLDEALKSRGPGIAPGKKTASAPAQPRIALYVSAMGLNPTATRTAIETMPAEVTLAFLPSAAPALVEAAKARGHEVLLQLPMQNAPGNPATPHVLKPDEDAVALSADLAWATSRFGGYVGFTNLLGAPVMANTATMTAVLRAAAGRNLFFLDDGTSKRSVGATLSGQLGVPETQADLVIDATADPAVVRANLDSLIAIARRKGQAVGMASGLPDHLAVIARFAADLNAKNVALVPVSALARREASVATTGR